MGSRVSPRMKSSASRYSNTQQASVELSGPTQPLDSHFRLRFPVSTPPSATLFHCSPPTMSNRISISRYFESSCHELWFVSNLHPSSRLKAIAVLGPLCPQPTSPPRRIHGLHRRHEAPGSVLTRLAFRPQ